MHGDFVALIDYENENICSKRKILLLIYRSAFSTNECKYSVCNDMKIIYENKLVKNYQILIPFMIYFEYKVEML